MKKRAVCMIFISVFLVLTFIPVVFAASNNILSPVDDLMLQIIPNQDIRLPNVRDNVSLYIFATFAIIYAIVFASTGMVPLFQNERGARIAVAIAFAIMGVLFPGAIRLIASLTPVITIILVMFAVVMIMVTGFKGFGTGAGALPAEWQRERMDLGRERGDYRRERREERQAESETKGEERALRDIQGIRGTFNFDINRLESSLGDLRRRLSRLKAAEKRAPNSQQVIGERQAIIQDMSNAIQADYGFNRIMQQVQRDYVVARGFAEDATTTQGAIETQIRTDYKTRHRLAGGAALDPGVDANIIAHSTLALQQIQNRVRHLAELQRLDAQLQHHVQDVNNLLTQLRNELQTGDYAGAEAVINQCIQEVRQEKQEFDRIQRETKDIIKESDRIRKLIRDILI
jgi:hypothetical protein